MVLVYLVFEIRSEQDRKGTSGGKKQIGTCGGKKQQGTSGGTMTPAKTLEKGQWLMIRGVCAASSPGCPRTESFGKHTRQLDGPVNGTETTS